MTAQAVTITEREIQIDGINRIIWDWTSTDAGAVVGSVTTFSYSGVVVRASFIPDTGDTAPTTAYDMTIKDEDGIDVLGGLGADLTTSNSYKVFGDGLGVVRNSTLTLAITNAGDANGGKVILDII